MISASAPTTVGVENDVPLHIAHPANWSMSGTESGTIASYAPSKWSKNSLTRSSPGAHASTHGPWLENGDGQHGPIDATDSPSGIAAGNFLRHPPSLPAAATTTAPSATSARIQYAIIGGSTSP